ncbi:MAG TPA: choice-of-anchor tandem repeat GloVer-containing protein [Candidatus Sulfotelmatobacter sp.]|nr:choice-of-anchor tandem repeat GloVer-containing protein [Candidatus Sulfotelmatobacter sp.]
MKRIATLLITVAVGILFIPCAGAQDTVKTLLSFDGTESEGNLIFDSVGNLYGTTGDQYDPSLITVFKLSPNSDGTWTENVLWTSTGNPEPMNIRAGVIFDASGNLYGTSLYGGASNCGTVFKLTHNADGSWSEKNLHDFDCTDGYQATGGVIFDSAGNLYGTTSFGGTSNWGVVYELSPNADGSWTETTLHNFTFGNDGGYPGHGSLAFDSAGNLYGTAGQGAQGTCFVWTTGCGTVFEMSPKANGTWSFKTIHSFTGGDDGGVPQYDLKFDSAGNLYSTTYVGGKYGYGVVFELIHHSNDSWSERVVHHFRGGGDGAGPFGGVIFDAAGNLYGTTSVGGDNECFNAVSPGGCGTVYKLTPKTTGGFTHTVLVRFHGKPNNTPYSDLVIDNVGNLYGAATGYGTYSSGTVYEVIP